VEFLDGWKNPGKHLGKHLGKQTLVRIERQKKNPPRWPGCGGCGIKSAHFPPITTGIGPYIPSVARGGEWSLNPFTAA